jgi:ribosome-associated toxin RatA of RatAB toxin-antitoxin module
MITRRTRSINLNAPQDAVFAVLADYNAYSVWLPGVSHSRVLAVDNELGIAYAEFVWPVYLQDQKFSMEFIREPLRSITYRQTDQFRHRGLSGQWEVAPVADGRGVAVTGRMCIGTDIYYWFSSRRKLRTMLDGSLDAVRRRVAQVVGGGAVEEANGKLKVLEITTRRDSAELWLFGKTYLFKQIDGASWHDQEIRGNQGAP